jgi:two-component system, cell cycle sensor histidine kinase and response regulator CckA
VMQAGTGEAGLAAATCHDGPIDLVITDVVMPGMGGRELVQQLAQSHPATKVLYLSGYTEETILGDGNKEHGASFLQKPFTLQTLARKVKEILS